MLINTIFEHGQHLTSKDCEDLADNIKSISRSHQSI